LISVNHQNDFKFKDKSNLYSPSFHVIFLIVRDLLSSWAEAGHDQQQASNDEVSMAVQLIHNHFK